MKLSDLKKISGRRKITLKQFVFEKMAKGEYITDQSVARFLRANNWSEERDIPYSSVETYKREYEMLEWQKSKFDDLEEKTIHSYKNSYKHAKTKYFLEYKGIGENRHQPITKAYFNYLKEKGIKELSDEAKRRITCN